MQATVTKKKRGKEKVGVVSMKDGGRIGSVGRAAECSRCVPRKNKSFLLRLRTPCRFFFSVRVLGSTGLLVDEPANCYS